MATGHDIAMGLRAAYLSMHRQTNHQLAACGMTADQFVLLALLAEQDGITQQELVRRASSDRNTIRAMLVLLENRGLVARGRHPEDGRARAVTLTRKGRQAYDRLLGRIKPLQEVLLSLFGDGQSKRLVMFLNRISEAMAQQGCRRGQARCKASGDTANS